MRVMLLLLLGELRVAPRTAPLRAYAAGCCSSMGVVTVAAEGGPFPRTPVGMLIPGPNRYTPSCACSPGTTTARVGTPTPAPASRPPDIYGEGVAPLWPLEGYWDAWTDGG